MEDMCFKGSRKQNRVNTGKADLPRCVKLDKYCAKTDHRIKITVGELKWFDLKRNMKNLMKSLAYSRSMKDAFDTDDLNSIRS